MCVHFHWKHVNVCGSGVHLGNLSPDFFSHSSILINERFGVRIPAGHKLQLFISPFVKCWVLSREPLGPTFFLWIFLSLGFELTTFQSEGRHSTPRPHGCMIVAFLFWPKSLLNCKLQSALLFDLWNKKTWKRKLRLIWLLIRILLLKIK